MQGDEGNVWGGAAFLSERGRFRELSGQHRTAWPVRTFSFIQIMSRSCSVKHHGRVTYDADVLKTFWEKRIELHMEQLQKEDMRIRRSALDR